MKSFNEFIKEEFYYGCPKDDCSYDECGCPEPAQDGMQMDDREEFFGPCELCGESHGYNAFDNDGRFCKTAEDGMAQDKMYTREEVISQGRKLLSELEIDEEDVQEWFDNWSSSI